MFTARYALSPYIKQIHFVFKGLMLYAEMVMDRPTDITINCVGCDGLWAGR
jgi:hypothetical protein